MTETLETIRSLKNSRWLAERLGISLTTIESLRKKNPEQLPPCLYLGQNRSIIRYDEQTVEHWLQQQMQIASSFQTTEAQETHYV